MPGKSLDDIDVSRLSDDDLYQRLSNLGVSVGPIVRSTRRIYENKLIKLMGGDVVDSSFTEMTADDEEYSDSETGPQMSNGNEVEQSRRVTRASQSPTLRQRAATEKQEYRSSSATNSLSFDHDRHTPSPRPSLRTVTSSTSTKYTTSGGNIRETRSLRHTYLSSGKDEVDSDVSSSTWTRVLVKCVIIIILLAALYFSYQYMYSESPFKGLEKLAKQALESANEKTKKGAKVQTKS